MLETREVADLMLGALNDHDVERALRYFSPDAVLVSPIGVAEGHEQIAWYFDHFIKGFPNFALTVWHRAACGAPVFTEWTLTGTHTGPFLLPQGEVLTATGRRIAVRGCGCSEVGDHLIITHRDYFDQLELFAQLGFSLTSGGGVCDVL